MEHRAPRAVPAGVWAMPFLLIQILSKKETGQVSRVLMHWGYHGVRYSPTTTCDSNRSAFKKEPLEHCGVCQYGDSIEAIVPVRSIGSGSLRSPILDQGMEAWIVPANCSVSELHKSSLQFRIPKALATAWRRPARRFHEVPISEPAYRLSI
eukprot:s35_g14.t1